MNMKSVHERRGDDDEANGSFEFTKNGVRSHQRRRRGEWPSGTAAGFGPEDRGFESLLPSQPSTVISNSDPTSSGSFGVFRNP